MAVCNGDHGAGNQFIAVVQQDVAHRAQSADIVAFAIQPSTHIGGGRMRLIAAAFTFEIAAVMIVITAIFTNKTFMTGSCLNESAVNTEVLARKQALALGLREHQTKEFNDCVVLNQSPAVLGEDGRHPDGIYHGRPNQTTK